MGHVEAGHCNGEGGGGGGEGEGEGGCEDEELHFWSGGVVVGFEE